MIKKLVVRTARRYPHYEEFVYENISNDYANEIQELVFRMKDLHFIEDFEIAITK